MSTVKARVALILAAALGLGIVISPMASAISPSRATKPNPAIYAFTAKTIQGANFSGKSLVGKPTVLWFWAPWCSICRGESSDIASLAKSFKGKINLVGIAGLGPLKDMKQFVSDTKTGTFPHIADVDGSIWNHFEIISQPSFVFIASTGLAYRQVGALSKSELYKVANDLIKNKALG